MDCYDLRSGREELADHHQIRQEHYTLQTSFSSDLRKVPTPQSRWTIPRAFWHVFSLHGFYLLVGILPKEHVILVEVFLESIHAE